MKCPKCGTENTKPNKTWALDGRPDALGNRIRLVIGAFDCPMCFTRFREVIDKGKISDTGGKSPVQPPQMCETAGKEPSQESDILTATLHFMRT